jgi:glycerol-3-phosphate dehydrogenase
MQDEQQDSFDLLIVGGGINGAGIARDAAGRGYSVCLVEQGDIGGATSSWSTKLIHGGLRYLEHYEFRLVREALIERERLWAMAPHIIRPLRFILPLHKQMRPAWLLRLGLFLYDHLGGRKRLPATSSVDLANDPCGGDLAKRFTRGFEYSDCQVDDARLTLLNARDAAARGADVRVQTALTKAVEQGGQWHCTLQGAEGETTVRARMVINAAGPWVDHVLRDCFGQAEAKHVRLVQGSHLIVRRLFAHDRAFIFQEPDGRIIFAIPYQQDFTLIGTTDYKVDDPASHTAHETEIEYLIEAINVYLEKPIQRGDVVGTYAGVRALYNDGASKAQETTRDYVLAYDKGSSLPLLNVFGGKLTTYRRLAESALEKIEARLGRKGKPWTAGATLPGGDMPVDGIDAAVAALAGQYPFLDLRTTRRLIGLYGSEVGAVLGEASSEQALGRHFGHGLYAREVEWMMDNEWARTADDVLWRRSKLGLLFDEGQRQALDDFIKKRTGT